MKAFIVSLSQLEDKLNDWNKRICMLLVESVTVHRDTSTTFKFHSGVDAKI